MHQDRILSSRLAPIRFRESRQDREARLESAAAVRAFGRLEFSPIESVVVVGFDMRDARVFVSPPMQAT